MTPPGARSMQAAACVVAVTGIVYAAMAYCLEPVDEFSVVGHPWQPTMLALHVLAAPWFVFALGMLWRPHVLAKLRSKAPARRRTGLALVVLSPPMVATGYLLPLSVDEGIRLAVLVVHLGTSAAFVVAFVTHVVVRRSRADLVDA